VPGVRHQREGPSVPDPRDPDEVVSPEAATTRAVMCQRCGWLVLRVAAVMEAASVAVEHLTAAGCSADSILIHPLAVAR